MDPASAEPAVAQATASLQGVSLETPVQSAAPKLPIPGQRNILITSALPYVNNVPHLGNIIGCVLSADVYARFCRKRGYNCIYICGTDEYGTATETKALEEGLTCKQICDKYHAIHKNIYEWFNISFDKFGRTSTEYQTQIAQDIFLSLHNNGCLVEQSVEQLYSEPLEKFLADRFVIGTCPKCKYEDARGDQCDSCGSLLNPVELINPKCKITGSTPVLKQTNHIFLDLPKLESELQQYIDNASQAGGWSSNCLAVTKAWMEQGLKLRAITRDLKWGTPVPLDGFRDKVFYVWFDAPIGYISITANYCGQDWKKWWQNKDVELVQFMGKDNVVFHTIIFPASLLGTQQPWTFMKSISVTEYLNYEAGLKFSKTRGTGVFGNDAVDTGIPADVFRYYLLATRPEKSDTEFNWDVFKEKFTADLNDNMGNFVLRVFKFIQDSKRFDGVVPGSTGKGEQFALALGEKVHALVERYMEAMEGQRLKEGLETAMKVSAAGNLFFTEHEIWKLIKVDRESCATLVSALAGLVVLLGALLHPFMPTTAAELLDQMGCDESAGMLTDEFVAKSAKPHLILPAGHKMNPRVPEPLFKKDMLDDKVVSRQRGRFGGQVDDDAATSTSGINGQEGGKGGAAKKAGDSKKKDGKAKDGKPKEGKPKEGKPKDGKPKDGKPKDGKTKKDKAKDQKTAGGGVATGAPTEVGNTEAT